jgi:hypothetical protein
MQDPRRHFQYSLRSLLVGTTGFAVVLAFIKISGCEPAIISLFGAMLSAGVVWIICFIAKDTRRRVRIHIVAMAALLGTSAAGSFCVYYWRIDIAKIHLTERTKVDPRDTEEFTKGDNRETLEFRGWSYFGGFGGAVAGALLSWHATRLVAARASPPSRDHQKPKGGAAGEKLPPDDRLDI